MADEITKQALGLFDECTKILNGIFRDNEMFWLAYQRHKIILVRLKELGFTVKTERRLIVKKESLLKRLKAAETHFTPEGLRSSHTEEEIRKVIERIR